MTLTKADLINEINASTHRLNKTQARIAMEAFLDLMKANLANGDDVLLSGFGKFSVKEKSARKGRNPQTGVPLMLEGRKVVTFKPSGMLRKKMNGR